MTLPIMKFNHLRVRTSRQVYYGKKHFFQTFSSYFVTAWKINDDPESGEAVGIIFVFRSLDWRVGEGIDDKLLQWQERREEKVRRDASLIVDKSEYIITQPEYPS
jgi:hypothetical protein